MLSLFQPIACWQCQMRSLLTRLVGGRFQLCNQCNGRLRQVESAWATWAQVAGAVPPRVSEASKPAKPIQPSAPSIAKVAPPAAAANVPKADAKRFEPVRWRD